MVFGKRFVEAVSSTTDVVPDGAIWFHCVSSGAKQGKHAHWLASWAVVVFTDVSLEIGAWMIFPDTMDHQIQHPKATECDCCCFVTATITFLDMWGRKGMMNGCTHRQNADGQAENWWYIGTMLCITFREKSLFQPWLSTFSVKFLKHSRFSQLSFSVLIPRGDASSAATSVLETVTFFLKARPVIEHTKLGLDEQKIGDHHNRGRNIQGQNRPNSQQAINTASRHQRLWTVIFEIRSDIQNSFSHFFLRPLFALDLKYQFSLIQSVLSPVFLAYIFSSKPNNGVLPLQTPSRCNDCN